MTDVPGDLLFRVKEKGWTYSIVLSNIIFMISIFIGTQIGGRQRLNLTEFGDPLNFPLAPPELEIWFRVKYLDSY